MAEEFGEAINMMMENLGNQLNQVDIQNDPIAREHAIILAKRDLLQVLVEKTV